MNTEQVNEYKRAATYAVEACKPWDSLTKEHDGLIKSFLKPKQEVTPKRRVKFFIEQAMLCLKQAGVKVPKLPGHLGSDEAIKIHAHALADFVLKQSFGNEVELDGCDSAPKPVPQETPPAVICETTKQVAQAKMDGNKAAAWIAALDTNEYGLAPSIVEKAKKAVSGYVL